ncbi:hypothetical protein HAX54_028995 [Datura stramonium]|uniref:Uncharacterized protein n=1 Tax=Datura stramonium TaxID=4076 RepID=A0ABS8V7B3_DATST|nr:hypothetical protein [Datura stramonium]
MQKQRRAWDDLPSTALVNIFSKSSLKDRIYNLPLLFKTLSMVDAAAIPKLAFLAFSLSSVKLVEEPPSPLCPNLKHLSFHGSFHASEEVLLEVVRSCPNLDLVDFSDSPYLIPSILQEMGIHCPNIRGIRRNGVVQPLLSSSLIKCFPRLKLLNLSDSSIGDRDLLTLVTGYSRLEYLDIMRCQSLMLYMYIIKGAHRRIAEIHYD